MLGNWTPSENPSYSFKKTEQCSQKFSKNSLHLFPVEIRYILTIFRVSNRKSKKRYVNFRYCSCNTETLNEVQKITINFRLMHLSFRSLSYGCKFNSEKHRCISNKVNVFLITLGKKKSTLAYKNITQKNLLHIVMNLCFYIYVFHVKNTLKKSTSMLPWTHNVPWGNLSHDVINQSFNVCQSLFSFLHQEAELEEL